MFVSTKLWLKVGAQYMFIPFSHLGSPTPKKKKVRLRRTQVNIL